MFFPSSNCAISQGAAELSLVPSKLRANKRLVGFRRAISSAEIAHLCPVQRPVPVINRRIDLSARATPFPSATDGRLGRRLKLLFSLQPILKVATRGAAALHEKFISAVLDPFGISYRFAGEILLALMFVMFHFFGLICAWVSVSTAQFLKRRQCRFNFSLSSTLIVKQFMEFDCIESSVPFG